MNDSPMEKRPFDRTSLIQRWSQPPILSHLRHLTTKVGMVQHTIGRHHDLRFGYSIDDQARALIICVWYAQQFGPAAVSELAPVYFRFLEEAQISNGRFHNFRDADGHWLDADGGDDPLGRSLWALGILIGYPDYFGFQSRAQRLYDRARVCFRDPSELWTRSLAYGLLGAQAAGDASLVHSLAVELKRRFNASLRADWPWFEDTLRYANGIVPYALLVSGDESAEAIALRSLEFLNTVSRVDGWPAPIGNRGWYPRGGKRAVYDQQCLEAADMILANGKAWERTGDRRYLTQAEEWFGWFFGFNTRQVTLVTKDGGCYDGIGETDVNESQGAESTIAYLFAHLELYRLATKN